jgi:hypothetical protein
MDHHRDEVPGRDWRPVDVGAAPSGAGSAGGEWRSSRAAGIAAELRCRARVTAGSQAAEIRLVAALVAEVEAVVRAELAGFGARVPGQPDDEEVVADAVLAEVQGALGVGAWWAGRLIEAATRLSTVHSATLAAVEAGRLDLARARQLAAATEWLPEGKARRVEAEVLAGAGDAPWAGPSPRAWRDRLARAVVRVAPEEARRRRERAVRARAVWTWMVGDGTGELHLSAADIDIQMAEEVITGLAQRWPAVDPAAPGAQRRSMDQRRVDALIDLFRRVRDGDGLPTLPVRREHDIALVLPADTLFADPDDLTGPANIGPGDGPDADHGIGHDQRDDLDRHDGLDTDDDDRDDLEDAEDVDRDDDVERAEDPPVGPVASRPAGRGWAPGQRRGPGGRSYLDPVSAAALARREIALGAATTVLLTDPAGALVGQVRLPAPPGGAWTPTTLLAASVARLDRARPPAIDRYAPTVAQAAFVRARNPHCTGYDCPRAARRCDLDHDTPWPRGPTDITNLAPRCRRHHEQKTRALLHTELHPHGSVTTSLTGLTVTTRPEPLPGYDTGERRPGPLRGSDAADVPAA